ncbi:hypothetical protein DDZ15_02680 [Rhodohalobacter mucosus]|uniref:Uncharacterized protein n=2 Tax=Rhodohalobacter mucosus TaxID=2079485 RepID=A0A316TXC3_9BACT|nr:hypothetical protein DDZ15_02680 [Rhodohalobacter mucosus]
MICFRPPFSEIICNMIHVPVKKLLLIPVMALFVATSAVQTLSAQIIEADNMIIAPAPESGQVCILDPAGYDEHVHISAAEMRAKYNVNQTASSATFDIEYFNSCGGQVWPQQARNAIERAFDIWSTHLSSSVPIRIEANWIALAENTLGSAGPTNIVQFDPGEAEQLGAQPNTWYTIAQASAMSGEDLVTQFDIGHDIVMNINCQWGSWYFGTDANPPTGQIDLVSVVLHEIGHGIGFLGSMSANNETLEGSYGFGSANDPIIFDRFAEDGSGTPLLNASQYPNPSNALYMALTGQLGGIFFNGGNANLVNDESPVRLYSPPEWNGGSSYSHLDQNTYTDTESALMRPRIPSAFAIHSPGPVFCGMLGDWGWPLGGDCQAFIAADAFIAVRSLDNLELNSLEFGVTNIGSPVNRSFTISNEAASPEPFTYNITIENENYRIVPSSLANQTLQPGETVQLTVEYDPQNDRVHSGNLRIRHNAQNQSSPISVTLAGESLLEEEIARLEQNYPNPFNPETTIPFVLPDQANVRLDVYSIDGRLVKTLRNGTLPSGRYEEPYNLSDLASGMYLYRLIVDNFADTKKFLIVK